MVSVDPASPDAGDDELDLTPRPRADERRGSRVGPALVLLAVAAVIGFVLFQGLSGATLFLREANTAVAERDDLGERRFRLLGTPVAVTDERFELAGDTAVRFSVACDGIAVDVVHRGNVAESFQLGVPVVLEGRWSETGGLGDAVGAWEGGANDGWYFDSDRMLVKHDNEYRTDRIEEAASCGDDLADAPSN